MRMTIIAIILMFGSALAFADSKQPPWISELPKKQANMLRITCHGEGPDSDTARQAALNSCQVQASDQLNGNIEVRSLTIESEKSVAFHSEVSYSGRFTGLICSMVNQYIDPDKSVWIQCEFDLSKAREMELSEPKDNDQKSHPNDSLFENLPQTEFHLSIPKSHAAMIESQNKSLTILSVPTCEDLLITGANPRTVPCRSNPITTVIEPGDSSIIIRSGNGFVPKTLHLKKKRSETVTSEAMTVYLERR